jgi:hypothetical protein
MGGATSHDMINGGINHSIRLGDWIVLSHDHAITFVPSDTSKAAASILTSIPLTINIRVGRNGRSQTIADHIPSLNSSLTSLIRWCGYSILIWSSVRQDDKPESLHAVVFTPSQHVTMPNDINSIKLPTNHVAVLNDSLIVSLPHQLSASFLPFTHAPDRYNTNGGTLEIWSYRSIGYPSSHLRLIFPSSRSSPLATPAIGIQGATMQTLCHDISIAPAMATGDTVITRHNSITDLRLTISLLRSMLPRVLSHPPPVPHTATKVTTGAASSSTRPSYTSSNEEASIIPQIIMAYAEYTPLMVAKEHTSFSSAITTDGVALIDDMLTDVNERVWLNQRRDAIWLRTREVIMHNPHW